MSDEIQSAINAPKEGQAPRVLKGNVKKAFQLEKLNPAGMAIKKAATAAAEAAKKAKKPKKSPGKAIRAAQKKFYRSMVADN